MQLGNAQKLASWIGSQYIGSDLSNLKLQKLMFYAYAAALAYDLNDQELSGIRFEAWKLGPVCKEIWTRFKTHGSSPIPRGDFGVRESLSADLENIVDAVMKVYGRMTPAMLVEETHTEAPWINASCGSFGNLISSREIKNHFKSKFAANSTLPPKYLVDPGNYLLDSLPFKPFKDIFHVAEVVGKRWR